MHEAEAKTATRKDRIRVEHLIHGSLYSNRFFIIVFQQTNWWNGPRLTRPRYLCLRASGLREGRFEQSARHGWLGHKICLTNTHPSSGGTPRVLQRIRITIV